MSDPRWKVEVIAREHLVYVFVRDTEYQSSIQNVGSVRTPDPRRGRAVRRAERKVRRLIGQAERTCRANRNNERWRKDAQARSERFLRDME